MNDPLPPWQALDTRTITSVRVEGTVLSPGDRVRLRPRPGAEIFDLVLQGKTATICSIEEDFEGRPHVAVTIDDDPGRDLGEDLQIGHRFFFQVDEIEPLPPGGDVCRAS